MQDEDEGRAVGEGQRHARPLDVGRSAAPSVAVDEDAELVVAAPQSQSSLGSTLFRSGLDGGTRGGTRVRNGWP